MQSPVLLYELLFVNHQFKLKPQFFCCFPAENHTFQKNFKILDNRRYLDIKIQRQNHAFFVFRQFFLL